MNKQELIEKYEYMSHACFRRVDTLEVLKDLRQLDEPQKVTIPKFVANWIEYCKFTHVDLQHALIVGDVYFYNYANQKDFSKLKEFLETENNQDLFARAWIFGYDVEKEKRYIVKMKGLNEDSSYLNYDSIDDEWYFTDDENGPAVGTHHTRKQLEDAGFGEVFNSTLFEVEEVTE